VLYLSLNLGCIPVDIPETVRAVGAAVGSEPADVERLVTELAELIRS
jgi:hypothetical protein